MYEYASKLGGFMAKSFVFVTWWGRGRCEFMVAIFNETCNGINHSAWPVYNYKVTKQKRGQIGGPIIRENLHHHSFCRIHSKSFSYNWRISDDTEVLQLFLNSILEVPFKLVSFGEEGDDISPLKLSLARFESWPDAHPVARWIRKMWVRNSRIW